NCIYFIKNSNITSNPSLNKFENGNVIEIGLSGNNLNGDYFIDEENNLVYSIENGTSTLLVQNLSSSDVSQHSIFGSDQVQQMEYDYYNNRLYFKDESSPYDISYVDFQLEFIEINNSLEFSNGFMPNDLEDVISFSGESLKEFCMANIETDNPVAIWIDQVNGRIQTCIVGEFNNNNVLLNTNETLFDIDVKISSGCKDENATNYDSSAILNSNSCQYSGCTDQNFMEYNPISSVDDGSCSTLIIYGCTDESSYNYNNEANKDDGSCCYLDFDNNLIGQTFSNSSISSGDIIGSLSGSANSLSSINNDGNIVAIYYKENNYINVYQLNENNWELFGNSINFNFTENLSLINNISKISISGNGLVLSIADGTRLNIYEKTNDSWSLKYINNNVNITSQLEFDYSGTKLVATNQENLILYTRDITGWNSNIIANITNNANISSVDINKNGNRIVHGYPQTNSSNVGHVKVYELSNENNWQQIGSNIYGQNNTFGYDVSINGDGNIIASAGYDQGIGNAGIFEYNGYDWQILGNVIEGNSEYVTYGPHLSRISLSNDGNKLITSSINDVYGPSEFYQLVGNVWTNFSEFYGLAKINGLGDKIILESSFDNSVSVIKLDIECLQGCNDTNAINYDPLAEIDDGTCCYDCGRIEGIVFQDYNSNNSFDIESDIPLGPQIIQLLRSNGDVSYLTTEENGYYNFLVDTGFQEISYSPPSFWEPINNLTQYSIEVEDTLYSGLDFGITPEFTKGDMSIDLSISETVCNLTSRIWITLKNEGTETINNVNLNLWLDSLYEVSDYSGFAEENGNNISWNFNLDFYPFIYSGYELRLFVDVAIPGGPINHIFIDSARVTPSQINLVELNSTNNFISTQNTLLCSYDPNDKRLFPKQCFYEESDSLEFIVRFQNTGNYPAETVRLIDTLDLEKLDIMSFKVIGASHDYTWSLKEPSILEVVFDNIMLVDSSMSFIESQGFFKYKISLRDSISNYEPSSSSTYIYFDFNEPIITNSPEINFYSNLEASVEIINDSSSQSAHLNIISVTTPYSILWSNGDTSQFSENITIGSSNVTLIDNKNCIFYETFTVDCPETITSTFYETSCGPYNWNGQTYTESGIYEYSEQNDNNYSMSFDGQDDFIEVLNSSSLNFDDYSSLTIQLWIKNTEVWTSPKWSYLVTKSDQIGGWGFNGGFVIRHGADGGAPFGYNGILETTNGEVSFSSTGIISDIFENIAVVYDGNDVKYYRNGILTNTTSNISGTIVDYLGNIYFGSANNGSVHFFDGLLDDIHIWNVPLLQNEIQNYMNCPPIGIEEGLVGYWNFEEGEGNIVYDLSGNENHGAINGATYSTDVPEQSCQLTTVNGCDSVAILNLTINNSNTGIDTQVHCDTYTWIDGVTYTSSNNTASWILTNTGGCDSVVTLDLIINNSNTGIDTQVHCDTYTWIDGNTYTLSNNTATWTLTNVAGCDSVVTLDLTIDNSNTIVDTQVHCDTYTWIDGITYTSSNNTATYTLTNATGCDSVVTLNLTIDNSNTIVDTQIHCDTYTWMDGNTYTSSNNTATFTLTNVAGCDSVVTLDLTINNSNTGVDTQVHCDEYTWIDGVTYTESNNTATFTIENANNCDSIVTLNLIIYNSDNTSSSVIACNEFSWDGQTYTESGEYSNTYTNVNGCDSTHTLNLTINPTTFGTDTQVHCYTYTWIDGNTYNESNNTATFILTNSNNCDSIVALDLTINNSDNTSSAIIACDEFTWDGQTYTESGEYSNTYTNVNGCDSTHTLNLTINSASGYVTDSQVHCDEFTWIDGITYTESNNIATFTLVNDNNCDSIVTLDLTINQSTSSYDTVIVCDSFEWNNTTYFESGNYVYTSTNVNGCDSLANLDLTISQLELLSINGDQIAFTETENNTYSISSPNASSTYFWSLSNNVGSIDGGNANNSEIIITWGENDSETILCVYEEDEFGCQGEESCIAIDIKRPSTIKDFEKESLMVYPNPFTNQTTVSFYNPNQSKVIIKLIDARGRIVRTYDNITGNNILIKQQDLSKGIYYILMLTNYSIIRKPIIIK
ncbi:T9SS type A sorting domain-containing protein, partial [Flavobacteriales bacterium]|nr:T9SS type A sorting domain-containing protein [Flavobacteriales bacterium]